ncbi:MAG: fasciclin domain-containing protein [Myxococcota bacterium]
MSQLFRVLFLSISGVSTALASPPDIIDTAESAGAFETLLAALDAANLTTALRDEGPFTVFAPTDAAFAMLPDGTVERLLRPENRDDLKRLLTYHVIAGQIEAADAAYAKQATALSGDTIAFGFSNGQLTAAASPVSATDIQTANGVIHVVDSVLIPPNGPDAMSSSVSEAQEIIRLAIRRGAPLFNNGQPEACAAIYEVAARSLITLEAVDPDATATLRRALTQAEGAHSAADQAWALRRAFDQLLEQMASAS